MLNLPKARVFGGSPRPSPKPRPPLPPLPPGVRTNLPWTSPADDLRFLRANAWAITIPDAPVIPAGSSRHPERILSYLLDRYPADIQRRWLEQNAEDGYTHIVQSVADMMGSSVSPDPARVPPGGGMSLQQVIDFLGPLSQWGAVLAFLGSKYFQPSNMSTQQYLDWALPVVDALLEAKVVRELVPGWEWDLWNVPGEVSLSVPKAIGRRAHAAGVACYMHFSAERTSWFADGDPDGRFGYWLRSGRADRPDGLNDDVDGILYQADPSWDAAMLQARYVDTLWHFGREPRRADGSPLHIFRAFEPGCPTLQFDGDHPTETESDVIGFVGCCTVDNVHGTDAKVWGYGNGARRPNGDPL